MKSIKILIIVLLPALAFTETSQGIKHLELSTEGIHMLEVTCGAGSLVIRGVDDLAAIRVTARIEVESAQKVDMLNYQDRNVRLSLVKRKKKAVLLSAIERPLKYKSEARINLAVEIPPKINVSIVDGSGSISVDNLIGNLHIDDDTGKIKVENVVGKVFIVDGSGTIAIENIKGDVKIKDGSGSIALDNISGDVFIIDGSGDMFLEHIYGNVNVTDGSGDIDISEVLKNVFIGAAGSGEINTAGIKGKLTIRE
ncbi:MAG: DUF4097 domain-containing protein [Deltaproteobacteria bacterium]|nr:DUF4097 domain-containing protein [Deltaproteobacteria bacterium]